MVKLSSKLYRLKATIRKALKRTGRWYQRVANSALRWWRRYDRRWYPWWRLVNGLTALLMLAAIVLPVWQVIHNNNRYQLSSDALALVGKTDPKLQKQLTYDQTTNAYQFNKDAIPSDQSGNPLSNMQAQVGTANGQGNDKSLYALDVPTDFTKGVTYHDVNSGLSFSLTPKFGALPGKSISDHLVFPLASDSQAVYTLKGNGLKEDIVLNKVTSDTMSFNYEFNLPDTLAVKAIPNGDGAVGIYSADPSLFGNISYGSDSDRAAVTKARTTADKTYLVFGLPRPVVKDLKGSSVGSARYELNGNKLTVAAEGLSKAKGPLTIDPSVVVTSTSDFQTGGNNEGMIDFGTAGQVARGGLTGGSVGTWATTTSLTAVRTGHTSVAYNGYIYILGGNTTVNYNNDVQYAPLNSNGTIGTWQTTTSFTTGRTNHASVVYNGYLYVLGGQNGGSGSDLNDVQYAPINSNGTVGTWQATTSFTNIRDGLSALAYNGYMYILGGLTVSTFYNDVQYAPINANGTVGTWQTTTSFTNGRFHFGAAAYNGYMYILGGQNTGTFYNDVQYAPINANGTVGTWQATTSFTTTRVGLTSMINNGYIYVIGGQNGGTYLNTVQYAPINTNGTVGTWQTTTAFTTARTLHTSAAYNGYLYILGGNAGSSFSDTQYVKINPAGQPSGFATTSTAFSTARALACSVAYNGYLYVIGGSTSDSNNNNVTSVAYTPLTASTGQTGTWTATTALPTATGSEGCTATGGYLYIMGGLTGTGTGTATNAVRYISISSTGALGASWTSGSTTGLSGTVVAPKLTSYSAAGTNYIYAVTAGSISVYRSSITASTGAVSSWTSVDSSLPSMANMGFARVGNYLYVFGGALSSASSTPISTVYYASIASDGSVANWQTTTSLNTAIWYNNGTSVNGCIYSLGGETSGGTSLTNVQYACPNSDGTISAWYNGPALSAATTDMAVTSYGGYVYGVGGWTTAATTATQFSAINNGGIGGPSSWSTVGTTISSCSTVNHSQFTTYGNTIYALDGHNGGCGNYYTTVNGDGSLNSWMPFSRVLYQSGSAVTQLNGYLYEFDGYISGSGDTTNSAFMPLNGDGSPTSSWSALTSVLSPARSGICAATYNGYIYVVGDGSTSGTLVNYAKPGSNGDITAWSSAANAPGAFYSSPTCAAYNGYLYIIGGYNGTSAYGNTVMYAPLNSTNGSVGTWQYTTVLPVAQTTSAVAYNGYMYISGGTGASGTALNTSLFAPILANGMLGDWQKSAALPSSESVNTQSSVVVNGRLYVDDITDNSDTLYMAPLQSISRISQYSKLVSLGTVAVVAGVTYNGTLPSVKSSTGQPAVTFRTAGSDGVFGAVLPAGGSLTTTSCNTSGRQVTYVEVSVVLDDSTEGVFADGAINANLTDLTINYTTIHPSPNIRLRSGQTLQAGTLSQLDTCINSSATNIAYSNMTNGGVGTTPSLNVPASTVKAGDIVVIFMTSEDGAQNLVTPSGSGTWTTLVADLSETFWHHSAWRSPVLTAAQAAAINGNAISGNTAHDSWSEIMVVVRSANGTTDPAAGTGSGSYLVSAPGTIQANSMTPSATSVALMFVDEGNGTAGATGGLIAPAGWTTVQNSYGYYGDTYHAVGLFSSLISSNTGPISVTGPSWSGWGANNGGYGWITVGLDVQ